MDGLRDMLKGARRADFCVGYFNLRGWGKIADNIAQLQGEDDKNGEDRDYCRLLIGMMSSPEQLVRATYGKKRDSEITQHEVYGEMTKTVSHFAEQLTMGRPSNDDEKHLQQLVAQLQNGTVRVKFHGRPLHAKLYLIHRQDQIAALTGFVGSSNLTLSGMEKNGELNVDVLEQDAAQKLAAWFDARWNDRWSVDISEDLANIIKQSWAGGPIPPYHIYLKTAYELSREAISGVNEYQVPSVFRGELLEFQKHAVAIAAKILNKENGVIIGDVVGLGKTITASAVAKVIQEDSGHNLLVICPPKLEDMWKNYIHNYLLSGDVLSTGKLNRLNNMRRYQLIIIDESHNFRNRESKNYGYLYDYIRANDARIILLTATPYNKAFHDIINQLRLFVSPDADLGIRPDNLINNMGGVQQFKAKHPQTFISSLSAFELSEEVDDWRELMRRYMVRRTRSHIKNNYAESEGEGAQKRHYLTFNRHEKYYFPNRKVARLDFSMSQNNDDYAKLYSEEVVHAVGGLSLPRYGLKEYIADGAHIKDRDKEVIDNLTRAGARLRGFARSGLFKRLESSGETFLMSVRRHIVRNAIFIAALNAQNGELPIGQILAAETDEALDAADHDLFSDNETKTKEWRTIGEEVYNKLHQPEFKDKFTWVRADYFCPTLCKKLTTDIEQLHKILQMVPQWKAKKDRKLLALFDLVQHRHGKDKILIFTQYKDTADYLYRELRELQVNQIALAHGGGGDIQDIVNRFSPHANHGDAALGDLRVLVSTDVLSEGQNLQDAHIIVNYDLPWTVIRLIQRIGRVDRIGQKAPEILCYSALPENGIEKIITLRQRLRQRIKENKELIGSDEQFLDGEEEIDESTLRDIYAGTAKLDETDDETDLLSRAFDIWQQATKDNPTLAKQIKALPNVVYSAKAAQQNGVIAYIKDGGNDVLAQLDANGEIISQSQSRILDLLECTADTKQTETADNHHESVQNAADALADTQTHLGGQLGNIRSVRRKLHNKLKNILNHAEKTPLLSADELRAAIQAVYDNPLTETAREKVRRFLRNEMDDIKLQEMVIDMHVNGTLCASASDTQDAETSIICSMGLRKEFRK